MTPSPFRIAVWPRAPRPSPPARWTAPLGRRPAGARVGSVLLASLVLLGLAAAPAVRAQSTPSLGETITRWARGNWASPVYCRIGGETVRGIRRVLIEPARNPMPGRTELELRFVDMQVADADRCFDLVGREVPNLVGKIQVRFNGTSHPETVSRDFERALRRDGGFAFSVLRGRLRVETVSQETHATRVADIAGSEAWLRQPARGSDAERALADFRSPRKLELEIALDDGARYRLPLFLADPR